MNWIVIKSLLFKLLWVLAFPFMVVLIAGIQTMEFYHHTFEEIDEKRNEEMKEYLKEKHDYLRD